MHRVPILVIAQGSKGFVVSSACCFAVSNYDHDSFASTLLILWNQGNSKVKSNATRREPRGHHDAETGAPDGADQPAAR